MAAPVYTNLATLKLALGIKTTDTTRDPLLNIALNGGARAIYRRTGKRRFDKDPAPTTRTIETRLRTVWDRRLCKHRLMLPDIATATGLLVRSPDWSVTYPVDILYPDSPDEPITGVAYYDFPWQVEVTATFGWPSVPDDIVQAHLLQSMRYYRRKDSPEGIAGSAEWGLVRVPRVDPDVEEMIADYCFPAVA